MPVLVQHLAISHEKHEAKKALRIEQQREQVIPVNYAVLIKAHLQLVEDDVFKKNAPVVLVSLAGENYGGNMSSLENSRCRDP